MKSRQSLVLAALGAFAIVGGVALERRRPHTVTGAVTGAPQGGTVMYFAVRDAAVFQSVGKKQ